uniref:Uncharacterized protein n=1 Tax=Sphaerodactylus townsendi TaxID=933632 RepID=A0ACB8EVN7_9SAUR
MFLLFPGYCSSETDFIKIKMIRNPSETISARVELDCEPKMADSGVYWVRQDSSNYLHNLLYVTARSEKFPKTTPNYEVSRSGNSYKLIVTRFEDQDRGIYHCATLHNRKLYFSSGLRIFWPVRTTQAPTTQRRALETPNTNKQRITSEPSKCPDVTDTGMSM